MVFLDLDASVKGTPIPFQLLEEISGECFMPLSYGGGIKTMEDIRRIIQIGIEKVIIGTEAVEKPAFVKQAVAEFGSSTVCVSLDIQKAATGYQLYTRSGTKRVQEDPIDVAKGLERLGVGELLIHSIDREGTQNGYDLDLIRTLRKAVKIPIIASGGAATLEHLCEGVQNGASAVAAGSMFVFHGRHQAVLISYPDPTALKRIYSSIQRK